MAFTESDWYAYCPITINSAQVPAAMPDGGESGFPVVLVIENGGDNWEGDAANIFAKVNNYANDIAITLDDGSTQLKHTIVEYNGASGSELLVCHILVPSLASATDTTLRLYYRDDGTTDQQQTVYLNADGWRLYLPLQEEVAGEGNIGAYVDLSDNHNDADDYCEATGQTGKVGAGQEFFKGWSDYIKVPDDDTLDGMAEFTVQVWLYFRDELGNDNDIFTKGIHGSNQPLVTWADVADTDYFKFLITDTGGTYSGVKTSATEVPIAAWTHFVLTFVGNSATGARLYINGSEDGNSPWDMTGVDDLAATDADLYIGNDANVGRPFHGYMDEVGFSAVARSADWIATTYNCQSDNDAFWTVGSEVLVSKGHPTLRRFLYIPFAVAA